GTRLLHRLGDLWISIARLGERNRQRDVELDDTPAAHHRAGLGWQLLRGGGPPRHRPRRFVLCGLGVAGGYLFLPRFQRDGERKLRRTPKMTTKACCRRRALTVTMCYYHVAAPERGAVGVSRSITWQVKLRKRTHQVFENKGFSFGFETNPPRRVLAPPYDRGRCPRAVDAMRA